MQQHRRAREGWSEGQRERGGRHNTVVVKSGSHVSDDAVVADLSPAWRMMYPSSLGLSRMFRV